MHHFSPFLLAMMAVPVAAQPPLPTAPAPASAAPAPAATTTISGKIRFCDCARGEHRVQLQAGRRYVISATSATFDPFLQLLRAGSEAVIAEDDDSGGGVQPRLAFTAPASGEYLVRVSSALRAGAGDYALNVQALPPLPALLVRPARVQPGQWQLFEGNLAAGSIENGRRYQDYELRLAAAETALIHVQGQAELDTMLQVFRLAERGNKPVAENDDAGAGLDPVLVFAPGQAGTYVVRVSGPADGVQSAYRLRIAR